MAKIPGADGFLDAMWACDAALGEPCARLDKKREKSVVAGWRETLRAQLAAAAEPAVVLHATVVLLHLEHSGAVLQAPGKLLAPLIDALEDKVGADAHGLLASYQREVHAALTDGGGGGGGAPALREGIDAVRRLALSPSKGGGGGGGGERVSASAADEAAEGDGGADAAAEAKAAAPKKKKRPPKAS